MKKVLPNGWIETELGEITTKPQYGWTTKSVPEGMFKYLRTTDIGKGKIKWNNVPFCEVLPEDVNKYLLEINDILISRAGSIGLSYLVDDDVYEQKSLFASYLIRFKPLINAKFISHFLNSKEYWRAISENSIGIAVQNINAPKLQAIPFPLPPLAEQERIVLKLEKLFAQHEKIKASLGRIPQLLRNFRQQVLTQAVTGKLTEQWREGKDLEEWNPIFKESNSKKLLNDKSQDYLLPKIPKEWKWVTVINVADVRGGKRLPKGENLVNYDTGFPYIKAGDIKNGNVNSENLQYLLETTQLKIKNYVVNAGDILITNVGACIGDIGIVPSYLDGANQTENALKLCNLVEVQNIYLSFWLRSPIAQNYIRQTVLSAGLGKLALGRIQAFPVPLTTCDEQQEVVNRIESLFAKADIIESRYQALKPKIANLQQAILHKAFKGELVPQLPTDGDAEDLLAEIMALKKESK